jgi:hypothetical protein
MTLPEQSNSHCGVCGMDLVEVERWDFTEEDFAGEKRRRGLGELTDSERQRFHEMIGESQWRQVVCPTDPNHTGFLAERIDGRQ